MWRWTTRILIGLCTGLIVAACSGATYQWISTRRELAETPPPGRLVDVGGHRLHIWCTGGGEPSVILETGLGGSTVGWGFVQPEVAGFTRVCSYDRAGLGYSDPGPSPRMPRRMARELEQLLDRSGIGGPWVLVAASSGGFMARLLASERSERVAGLVLVDDEDQAHEIPRLAPFVPVLSSIGALRLLGISFGPTPGSLAPSVRGFARATQFRAAGYQAAAAEILHIRESAAEVRSTRRELTIPLIVVTGARGADETWRHLQRDHVGLSRRGCQIIADQSGHVVPLEQPSVVVEAIRLIVDAVRERNDAAPCARLGAG
jgi:pimeloyl-ACP methyl ester carboxylesterase